MKSQLKVIAPLLTKPMYDFGFGKHAIIIQKLPITAEEYRKKSEEVSRVQKIPLKSAEAIVQAKVVEVEAFNKIMDHLSGLFKFNIDEEELKKEITISNANPAIKILVIENKREVVENVSRKLLMKKLIFNYLISIYQQLDVRYEDAEVIMNNNGLLKDVDDSKKKSAIIAFQQRAIENKIIDWLIRQYKIVINFKA